MSLRSSGRIYGANYFVRNSIQGRSSDARERHRSYVFVPPQRHLGPRIIIIALAIMIFAMVYLFVQRRNQKPVKESPVQQLQQENRSGSAFMPQ